MTENRAQNPTATLGTMDPFDPDFDNWSAYTERLEQFFVANDIAEGKKEGCFTDGDWYQSVDIVKKYSGTRKPATKDYSQLVEAMRSHLDPKPIVIAERFKFHRRNQREGESIAQYVAELQKLSEHCAFRDYLDQALRDRLVCGLTSEAMQKRLLTEKDLTLAKAQEIAMGMEAAAKKASELQVSSKGAEVNSLTRANPKLCFRCGKKGHAPENCYFRMQNARNVIY